MVDLFLDANFFISIVERRKDVDLKEFLSNKLFISVLSIHILTYLYKYRMPDKKLMNLLEESYNIVDFSRKISNGALQGPTDDFEDNVQLHSATQAECDLFLTEDKKLLSLKFFGKARMVNNFI